MQSIFMRTIADCWLLSSSSSKHRTFQWKKANRKVDQEKDEQEKLRERILLKR